MIEDAAHALPSCVNGTPIGAAREDSGVPVLTAFSFYATKNLTTIRRRNADRSAGAGR